MFGLASLIYTVYFNCDVFFVLACVDEMNWVPTRRHFVR